MKVLIFSLAYLPFVGGAELAVKEITNLIGDIDFDMVTVNLDGKQKTREQVGNINVYRIGKGKASKYAFPFSAYRFAQNLHKQNHYDAVWAIMANQAGLAALFFKKKKSRCKIFIDFAGGGFIEKYLVKDLDDSAMV
ncbi:MAG: hypothetical protein M1338_02195 [Patescibacteria group bacterium]|nr:hypothetical protein [Patescibacteria group bacterium]